MNQDCSICYSYEFKTPEDAHAFFEKISKTKKLVARGVRSAMNLGDAKTCVSDDNTAVDGTFVNVKGTTDFEPATDEFFHILKTAQQNNLVNLTCLFRQDYLKAYGSYGWSSTDAQTILNKRVPVDVWPIPANSDAQADAELKIQELFNNTPAVRMPVSDIIKFSEVIQEVESLVWQDGNLVPQGL